MKILRNNGINMSDENIEKFRVLCLDGGGVRGLYSAYFLKNITALFNCKYNEKNNIEPDIGGQFDLICGTSTGAILACALAYGVPISNIIELYTMYGPLIFKDPKPDRLLKIIAWTIKYMLKHNAQKDILKTCLMKCFDKCDLEQLYRQRRIGVCIPCIDASNHKPVVFKTPHHSKFTRDRNTSIVDACLASAAAPIYFPTHKIERYENAGIYTDGGLWANNPMLLGLIEAAFLTKFNKEIEIISVGTSDAPVGTGGKEPHKSGFWGWQGGIEVGLMAIKAQSQASSFMTSILSQSLSAANKRVTIYRFQESERSPEDCFALGTDKVSEEALICLKRLARKDASHNHSLIESDLQKAEHSMVKDIFSNVPPLR